MIKIKFVELPDMQQLMVFLSLGNETNISTTISQETAAHLHGQLSSFLKHKRYEQKHLQFDPDQETQSESL